MRCNEIKRNMKKFEYYYSSIMKSDDGQYSVDYYCTDGNISVWTGRINDDSPTAALKKAWDVVDELNRPRPFFGRDGRLAQWFWWKRKIRNKTNL